MHSSHHMFVHLQKHIIIVLLVDPAHHLLPYF